MNGFTKTDIFLSVFVQKRSSVNGALDNDKKAAKNKFNIEIDTFVGKCNLIINLNVRVTTNHIESRDLKKETKIHQ